MSEDDLFNEDADSMSRVELDVEEHAQLLSSLATVCYLITCIAAQTEPLAVKNGIHGSVWTQFLASNVMSMVALHALQLPMNVSNVSRVQPAVLCAIKEPLKRLVMDAVVEELAEKEEEDL